MSVARRTSAHAPRHQGESHPRRPASPDQLCSPDRRIGLHGGHRQARTAQNRILHAGGRTPPHGQHRHRGLFRQGRGGTALHLVRRGQQDENKGSNRFAPCRRVYGGCGCPQNGIRNSIPLLRHRRQQQNHLRYRRRFQRRYIEHRGAGGTGGARARTGHLPNRTRRGFGQPERFDDGTARRQRKRQLRIHRQPRSARKDIHPRTLPVPHRCPGLQGTGDLRPEGRRRLPADRL